MTDIKKSLRKELLDKEYAQGYAESFLNAFVATQIKAIREQREMTQADLATAIGTTQTGISRIENVNYSSWSIRTLIKLARAFDVRLRVSFEPFGSLPDEVVSLNRQSLERVERGDDPALIAMPSHRNLGNLISWPSPRAASVAGLEGSMSLASTQKGVAGYGETRSANG